MEGLILNHISAVVFEGSSQFPGTETTFTLQSSVQLDQKYNPWYIP